MYAVGFATRQLPLEVGDSHNSSMGSSGSCSSFGRSSNSTYSNTPGGTSSGGCTLLQHAQSGCYQLLHAVAVSQLQKASVADGDPLAHLESRQRWWTRQQLLSRRYVVPRMLLQAAPLLDSAVLGPNDPLVPLQQQQRVQLMHSSLKKVCRSRIQLDNLCRTAPRKYVQLADPAGAAQHERIAAQRVYKILRLPAAEQQQQDGGQRQQQQQQQQQPWLIDAAEASSLLLAPPMPPDCLLSPGVWWAWQQQLMGMDTCDACGRHYKPDQVRGATLAAGEVSTLRVMHADRQQSDAPPLPLCSGAAVQHSLST